MPLRALLVLTPLLVAAGCASVEGRRDLRLKNAMEDITRFEALAPMPTGPLDLLDAIDLALRHNLELHATEQEQAYQRELLTRSHFRLLPSLNGSAEYARRDSLPASSSISLQSGDESLEPSYSSDKRTRQWNLSAAWNLLDFGVGFLRSRQAAHRVAMSQDRLRRARQDLVLKVTESWWRAVAARESMRSAQAIQDLIDDMQREVRKQIDQGSLSRIEGLRRQDQLLERGLVLRRVEKRYHRAVTELTTLIGIPPGGLPRLAAADFEAAPPAMLESVAALEEHALAERPELYAKDAEERISLDEARVAVAEMFPSPSVFWRYTEDGNPLLYTNQWQTAGAKAAFNLLSVPEKIFKRRAARAQGDWIRRQRVTLSVAILTQLHLAWLDHAAARQELQDVATFLATRRKLLDAVDEVAGEGQVSGAEALDVRMKHLLTRTRYLDAYVEVIVARARIYNTAGRVDPDLTAGASLRSIQPGGALLGDASHDASPDAFGGGFPGHGAAKAIAVRPTSMPVDPIAPEGVDSGAVVRPTPASATESPAAEGFWSLFAGPNVYVYKPPQPPPRPEGSYHPAYAEADAMRYEHLAPPPLNGAVRRVPGEGE